MCGRYTVSSPADLIADYFDLGETPELARRYNVAPTQEAPVVRLDRHGRPVLSLLRWGLVPYWARDSSIGNRMINARSETVATKPAYREAFERRRCLVVADGFYEWRKTAEGKQPILFRLAESPVFAFAGLWERWRRAGEGFDSFTILTTTPNELVRPVHDRMPVVLDRDDHAAWLDRGTGGGEVETLLRPVAAGRMLGYPVSTVVNNPANEIAACVEPTGPPLEAAAG